MAAEAAAAAYHWTVGKIAAYHWIVAASSTLPNQSATEENIVTEKVRWVCQLVKPYTLHPTPYTLNPTSYTLHFSPFTLYSTLYTVHSSP
jgi:hypothetical protein